jgi:transglutaminase-like putative cysteine protease
VVLAHDAGENGTYSPPLNELDSHRMQWEEQHFDFMAPSGYVPHLNALREIIRGAEERSGGTIRGFVQAASDAIHGGFQYVKGATHVSSSIEDSLSVGAGVCQDFAHLLLGVVRMRGLPARYVSGYLVPNATAEASQSSRQEEVIGGQASHAWTEVLIPEVGWHGFDPTLGKPVSLRHVRIAYGRDYGDVAPVRGVYKGQAGQRLAVDVRVRPALDDDGREQLSERAAPPVVPEAVVERPQQPAQQQQQ